MEQEDGKTGRFGDCSDGVIGACIEVHRTLGPGLLESAYEECVAHELGMRRLRFERQRAVPQLLTYLRLTGYGVGLLVNFRENILSAGLRRLTLTQTFPSSRLPVHPTQNEFE